MSTTNMHGDFIDKAGSDVCQFFCYLKLAAEGVLAGEYDGRDLIKAIDADARDILHSSPGNSVPVLRDGYCLNLYALEPSKKGYDVREDGPEFFEAIAACCNRVLKGNLECLRLIGGLLHDASYFMQYIQFRVPVRIAKQTVFSPVVEGLAADESAAE